MQLREHSFLRRFPDDLARDLALAASELAFADGYTVFNEGERADAIYLVLDGLIELSKDGETRSPVIATVLPDEYFGEVGILSETGRSARAVCRGASTRVARIAREPFLSVVHRAPVRSVIDLLSKIGTNLRDMDERYVRDVLRKERLSLIGEMANKVIHDFKGPFTAISIGVEMIDRLHGDKQTRKYCDVMNRNLTLMQQMMQEILDFTAGNQALHREPTPLRAILDDLVEDNQQWLDEQKVKIEVHGPPVVVDVDRGRIRRALQNLLINSLEAFQRGAGNTVMVSMQPAGTMVEMIFEDNGPGLPRPLGASVFDPFVSIGKKGGTGLGLSIAKGIVEAHGGSISLGVRKEGPGAMFRIHLPCSHLPLNAAPFAAAAKS